MSEKEIEEILKLKNDKFFRPYAKLLILLHRFQDHRELYNIMREVLGGSYIYHVKEAVTDGLVVYEKGEFPRLTEKGRKIAEALYSAWRTIQE